MQYNDKKTYRGRLSALATTVYRGCLSSLVTTILFALSGAVLAGAANQQTTDKLDLMPMTAVITATNPYTASWLEGALAVTDKQGLQLQVVKRNCRSEREFTGIQALAAQSKMNVQMAHPAALSKSANTLRLNGRNETLWKNKPDNYESVRSGHKFICFDTYRSITADEGGAKYLIETKSGEGSAIALQVMPAREVHEERFAGLV